MRGKVDGILGTAHDGIQVRSIVGPMESGSNWGHDPTAERDLGERSEPMNALVDHDVPFRKWWFRLENRLLKYLLRAGFKLGTTYILSVAGRETGTVYSTPVVIVEKDGERYLVAPYGPVNWVLNARAAGTVTLTRARRSESVLVVEVAPQESAPILKKYVGIASATRRYFHAKPDAPVQDFTAEAPQHPVFRLVA